MKQLAELGAQRMGTSVAVVNITNLITVVSLSNLIRKVMKAEQEAAELMKRYG